MWKWLKMCLSRRAPAKTAQNKVHLPRTECTHHHSFHNIILFIPTCSVAYNQAKTFKMIMWCEHFNRSKGALLLPRGSSSSSHGHCPDNGDMAMRRIPPTIACPRYESNRKRRQTMSRQRNGRDKQWELHRPHPTSGFDPWNVIMIMGWMAWRWFLNHHRWVLCWW